MSKKEKKVKAKKETKLYMLECISIHKVRYCVETDQEGLVELENRIKGDGTELIEFSQEYMGEKVFSVDTISDRDAYLKIFNKDNAYLARWDDEKKMEFINKK